VKHLRVLNVYFTKYKWHFAGGLLFVALSTIFGTWQGIIIRKGTNRIVDLYKGTAEGSFREFILYGLTLIGFALTSGIFMFLMRQTIIVMSRHIEFDQKNQIYKHYQELDTSFFKTHTTGDLMNRISEDVSRVRMYTGPAIMYLSNTVVTTVTIVIFMLNVSPRLTLFVFLPLPILSFIIYKVSDLINRQGTKVQEELGALTSQAQESFSAIRLIKAYAREDHFIDRMREKGETYKTTALKLASIEAMFAPVMGLMVGLSVLITVWYGGRLVIAGDIQPGNITEFVFYVFRLTWPFASLGWVTSLIQRAAASQERINEFLDTAPAVTSTNTSVYPVHGALEFRNVSFSYPENGMKALDNVSFSLPAGSTLGITGPVGSGKSTVIAMLTRLYDPDSGQVLVDGRPVKDHHLQLLRRNTGVVPQEVFLFSDTIANNIGFGSHEGPDRKSIEGAARQAGIYDNIISFPDKFETLVGERGVTLSGGQKQRISIARAIIGKPVMLFFDDCLSAVDSETEELILSNLRSEMKGRTCVIISHRISGIRHADKILYLKDGAVLEEGTHESLMAANGAYAQLYRLQQ
jgi:ATP-binding cassette, subfamily B, multidrug efflux pump